MYMYMLWFYFIPVSRYALVICAGREGLLTCMRLVVVTYTHFTFLKWKACGCEIHVVCDLYPLYLPGVVLSTRGTCIYKLQLHARIRWFTNV